jgi:elongation factor G
MTRATGFSPQDIRNVVLLGHGGSGKTTLAEALLFRCGAITRMGSVEEASTTADFEPEAKAHKHSISSSLLFATREGRELNIIDTPGHPDFVGQALAAMPVVETALIVVNATAGIEFNTRRLFQAAGEAGLARMVVVNKIDAAPQKLPQLVKDLREAFGVELHCLNLPSKGATDVVDCFDEEAGQTDFGKVADVHRELLESVVEVDDAELEKYLSGEKIPLPRLRQDFVKAMTSGHVVPILFVSAKSQAGIDDLLHVLVEEAPSPVTGRARRLKKGDELVEVACDAEQPFLAHVFKVTHDPFLGQLAMLRILQGKLGPNTAFVCGADKKLRKAGHVLKVEGRERPEMESTAMAGDLVALAKIDDVHVNQVLHDVAITDDFAPAPPKYPTPMVSLAVAVKNRQDEVKFGQALTRMAEEDPTFRAGVDPATNETIVSCLGDLHLRVSLEKLKNRHRVDVETKLPTIAYRETITARAEGHYRHKKQTGGAGQFGEVFLRMEPLPRGSGLVIEDEVFGGAIPTQYIPSVEKGIHDAVTKGTLAGFPIVDVKVTITDGKSHPVDSKDIAFRTAGKFAVRDAYEKARPVLLEPVVTMEVSVPEANVGDVTGHLKLHRGRVMGIEPMQSGFSLVHAQAPLAEVAALSTQLVSATAGQGSFVMEFAHYDLAPEGLAKKLAAQRNVGKEPEEG